MFELDTKLASDTIPVGALTLSRILLMNNSSFPWLILVPERSNMVEIIDLTLSERILLMAEISLVSDVMKKLYTCDKLNIANLGNQVPQLHVHIIARFKNDSAWPDPVWGKGSQPYTTETQKEALDKLLNAFSIHQEFTRIT